jgi:hypothetical protein
VRDRLCARTPVAAEILSRVGGDEEFCRLIVGKVVQPVEVDWAASRNAPITVAAPIVVGLRPGHSVVGPGYAKVVDARPIRPAEGIEERAITYVCVCYEPLAPGEAATDTSAGDV